MVDVSFIIPTRDRANYLAHSLRTCLANDYKAMEVLVLDNASVDHTSEVVKSHPDVRLRYVRSDARLSMRQNFERGLDEARGEILCFIGDDDGAFPDAVSAAVDLFRRFDIDAVSAARAHYFWPDFMAGRKNTALLPRHRGVQVRDSRAELKRVLLDNDYYKLPCLYHGFVRRAIVQDVRNRQGGTFFLSNNVDIFSSIALSMENLKFAFSHYPLLINGGSGRSNGASHFGGAGSAEKTRWKQEDDIGFLPAFAGSITMGSFIVESALRYIEKAPGVGLADIFGESAVAFALNVEAERRLAQGRPLDDAQAPLRAAGLHQEFDRQTGSMRFPRLARARRLFESFKLHRPVVTETEAISDVSGAAIYLAELRDKGRTGILRDPAAQLKAARRLARS